MLSETAGSSPAVAAERPRIPGASAAMPCYRGGIIAFLCLQYGELIVEMCDSGVDRIDGKEARSKKLGRSSFGRFITFDRRDAYRVKRHYRAVICKVKRFDPSKGDIQAAELVQGRGNETEG